MFASGGRCGHAIIKERIGCISEHSAATANHSKNHQPISSIMDEAHSYRDGLLRVCYGLLMHSSQKSIHAAHTSRSLSSVSFCVRMATDTCIGSLPLPPRTSQPTFCAQPQKLLIFLHVMPDHPVTAKFRGPKIPVRPHFAPLFTVHSSTRSRLCEPGVGRSKACKISGPQPSQARPA